jgi:serine/threonine-protein kinase RsbW
MAGDASSHHLRRGGPEGEQAQSRVATASHPAGGGRAARPDSDVRLTVPASAESIAVVRHALTALAGAYDLPTGIMDDVRLAVTEACANVVRHAYGDRPGRIEVTVRPDAGAVQVVVADTGGGMGSSPGTAGAGLGLPLIAAVTDSFAVESDTRAGGSRVVMSFRRALEPA